MRDWAGKKRDFNYSVNQMKQPARINMQLDSLEHTDCRER